MLPSRFAGTQPTFALDPTLPKLPLPKLADTLARYRALAMAFCESAEDVGRLDQGLQAAVPELELAQAALVKRHASLDNYIDEWWRIKAYLEDRDAIVPQESSTGDFNGQWNQTEHAALIMCAASDVHASLMQQTYRIIGPSESEPWSMHQFRPVFEACRVPRLGCDEHSVNFKTAVERPSFQGHFVVGCNGKLYQVQSGLPLAETLACVEHIVADAHRPMKPNEFCNVGYLTGSDRDSWARARQQLVSDDPSNLRVLHLIETALAFVTLDSKSHDSLAALISELSMPADAGSRWFDKSTQFVVFRNGRAGHSMEHSLYDAASQFRIIGEDIGRRVRAVTSLPRRDAWPRPTSVKRIEWGHVSAAAREMLAAATDDYRRRQPGLWTITTASMNGVGKAALRVLGQSPDSVVQMAMQCAWARMHGWQLPSVYESVQMVRYRRGRTEAGRCASLESKRLILALKRGGGDDEIAALLEDACAAHTHMVKEHAQGRGVDRHLMALRLQLAEMGRPVPAVLGDALWLRASAWDLSTSGAFLVTDVGINSTSFRPVAPHSTGVVYSIQEDHVDITVLALKARPELDCSGYIRALASTLARFVWVLSKKKPGAARATL